MASITTANIASSSVATPSSGNVTIFSDSTTKKLKSVDDTGLVTDYSALGSAITSLTGDVTASGPGAAAAVLTTTAVTGKLLTGLSSGPGTVTATDSILSAIGKLSALNEYAWFGTGEDGAVTYSSNQVLVRDMYFDTLVVQSGVLVDTAGFRIFCRTSCQCDGTIYRAPSSASGATAGAALAAGTLAGSAAGGAAGTTGAGTAGSASSPSLGGTGGAAGLGSSGAGGVGGTVTFPTAAQGGLQLCSNARQAQVVQVLGATPTLVLGGSGGGGGGGSGTNAGAGGAGGGVVVVSAKSLFGAGTISAVGGMGGTTPTTNGGGGGGGGGGVVALISMNDTTTTSLTVSVAGGLGGNGLGTGVNGSAGSVGRIYRIRV